MMKTFKIVLFFFGCLIPSLHLQAQQLDQLKQDLKNAKHDTTRCLILDKLIDAESDENIWPLYNEELMKISELHLKNVKPPFTAIDKFYLGYLSNAFNNKGFVFQSKGDFKKALEYFNRSIEIEKQTNNKLNISMTYNNIGGIYAEQKLFKNAVDFFSKSLELRTEMNDKAGICQSLGNLGTIYDEIGDTAKARIFFIKELKLCIEINDLNHLALTYLNLGSLYEAGGHTDLAINFYQKSLDLNTKIKDKRGMCVSLGNIADIYEKNGKHTEAHKLALNAFEIARDLGYPTHIQANALTLYNIEKRQKNWEEALNYFRTYVSMRDSLLNGENAKATIKQQVQFEFEKQKAVEHAVYEKELLVSNEREQKQKIISISIGAGLCLVFVFTIFIYNRLRITAKQKKIIEEQKGLVDEKNRIIEEKQKDILDSIRYAKRIQQSLLPSEKYIARNLKREQKP